MEKVTLSFCNLKCCKFWSNILGHFIKHKCIISKECTGNWSCGCSTKLIDTTLYLLLLSFNSFRTYLVLCTMAWCNFFPPVESDFASHKRKPKRTFQSQELGWPSSSTLPCQWKFNPIWAFATLAEVTCLTYGSISTLRTTNL